MKFQDHPTWKMLEDCRVMLKGTMSEIPRFHPLRGVVKDAHNSIVRLQIAVEEKLCQDSSRS